jgi:hypothetical protein
MPIKGDVTDSACGQVNDAAVPHSLVTRVGVRIRPIWMFV